MIRTLLLATACSLLAAGVPATGWAQGSPPATKPLRTLVYSVQFSATTTNEEHSSGFNGNNGLNPYGNATTRRTSSADDEGTLTANVIAATKDGGLAIDTAFAGKTTSQPTVRVILYGDGRVSAPSSPELSPEVTRLLPLLARGIVAERTIQPGATWTIPTAPPVKGAYTYHVTAVDGDAATLAIDVDMSATGPRGFDEHGKATATYDTARLCPLKYDYSGISRHSPAMDQYVTTSAHLSATLVSDSFAKR
ncbi:MAG TPA: hypothetical protein VHS78_14805 [Candidatus Elarobacter sp.]|jgi:hypothetical protein|nr:hypothetical protein [Candidatus Elarobacter sp.]